MAVENQDSVTDSAARANLTLDPRIRIADGRGSSYGTLMPERALRAALAPSLDFDLPLVGFTAFFLFVFAAEGPVKLHQKQ